TGLGPLTRFFQESRGPRRPGLPTPAALAERPLLLEHGLHGPPDATQRTGPGPKKRPAPSPHATDAEPMSARPRSLGAISSRLWRRDLTRADCSRRPATVAPLPVNGFSARSRSRWGPRPRS